MFLINWGGMISRWDPVYLSYLKQTKFTFKFPTQILRKVASSFSGGTPSKGHLEYWNGNIPWASPKDVKEFYLSDTEDYITEKGLCSSSSKLAAPGSVLLVVRSGILQHTIPVSVCSVPMAINQDIKVLTPNDDVLPAFLGYYFIVFNKMLLPRIVKHSTTVQSINSFELGKLPIPIPSLSIQKEIIEILDTAYAQKKEKDHQSEELLENINSYLLQSLNVDLVTDAEITLSDRIFCIRAKELLGGRFDPRKYSQKYKQIMRAIDASIYPKKSLREIVLNDVSGDWGLDDTVEDPDLISCLTIRGTEFDNKFNLNLDNNRTKFRKYKKASFNKIELNEKDILIEKSGGSEDQPVGRVAFIEKDMLDNYPLAFSNFIHRIRIDDKKAVPEYVFEYLRLMHNIKITEVMQTQTNGIRNLIMQEYFTQTILLPEPKKQEEIAIHAAQMRKRAFELQMEAEKIVSDAKVKVETMLLEDEQ